MQFCIFLYSVFRINQEEEVDASALRKELRRIVKIFCVTGWEIFQRNRLSLSPLFRSLVDI